ncbi:MAG: hypothetical protein KIT69_04395 [Propionibacteriaceae bacterium]|nr:hypothetical protein [Propionibacteriaceae bacterium]
MSAGGGEVTGVLGEGGDADDAAGVGVGDDLDEPAGVTVDDGARDDRQGGTRLSQRIPAVRACWSVIPTEARAG